MRFNPGEIAFFAAKDTLCGEAEDTRIENIETHCIRSGINTDAIGLIDEFSDMMVDLIESGQLSAQQAFRYVRDGNAENPLIRKLHELQEEFIDISLSIAADVADECEEEREETYRQVRAAQTLLVDMTPCDDADTVLDLFQEACLLDEKMRDATVSASRMAVMKWQGAS